MYKMKNILILSIDSPKDSFGGLGVSIWNMISKIEEYEFYTFGCGENFKYKNICHYNITDNEDNNSEYYIKNDIYMLSKILKELNRKIYEIDVVHVYDWMFIPLGLLLNEKFNIRLFYTCALSGPKQVGFVYEYFNKRKELYGIKNNESVIYTNIEDLINSQKLENKIVAESDAVIFVSEYYKSLFREEYESKYEVIQNGVDFDYYGNKLFKESYILPGSRNTKKVLYIGRLVIMKNIINLIDAKIPEGIEILVAAGKKGSVKWIYDMMIENPPDKFKYIGFIEGDYKRYVLQNVDAVIVPSIHEPFGIVNLEAIACKTLLINSRSSGMAEFITEDMCINCGVDKETIENALIKFLNMSEEEKIEKIENAYKKTKHLTWERNANAYKKLYKKYT